MSGGGVAEPREPVAVRPDLDAIEADAREGETYAASTLDHVAYTRRLEAALQEIMADEPGAYCAAVARAALGIEGDG